MSKKPKLTITPGPSPGYFSARLHLDGVVRWRQVGTDRRRLKDRARRDLTALVTSQEVRDWLGVQGETCDVCTAPLEIDEAKETT